MHQAWPTGPDALRGRSGFAEFARRDAEDESIAKAEPRLEPEGLAVIPKYRPPNRHNRFVREQSDFADRDAPTVEGPTDVFAHVASPGLSGIRLRPRSSRRRPRHHRATSRIYAANADLRT